MPLTIAKRLEKIEQHLAQNIVKQTRQKTQRDLTFTEFCFAHWVRSGGSVKQFNLWSWQSDVIQWVEEPPPPSDNPKLVVIIKGRQLGLSQLCVSWFLYQAWKNPGWTGVIISRTQSDSSLLANRMREMAGTGSLVKFTTDSLLKLQIRDGGTLHFRSAAVDAVRGIDSVSGLLFDEAAFQPQLKLSLSAALPAMSQVRDKGRVILCSTPNGASGPYFDQLNAFPDCIADIDKIRSGELGPVQKWVKPNGNIAIAIHWRAVYGDNPRYLEELQDSLGLPRSEVAQEYDLSLNEASEAVFGFAVVRACAIGEYEPWDPDGIYYWGVDPAGSGADYFTAICLRKTQDGLNVAKLYRKRTGTLEVHMAHIDNQIRESIPISVCVEGNGLGQFVYEALQGSHGSIVDKFNTTANSKAAIIGRLQLALECKKLTFPANSPIEQELLSFRRVGDKLQAAEGSHDDTVMALALALRAAS